MTLEEKGGLAGNNRFTINHNNNNTQILQCYNATPLH